MAAIQAKPTRMELSNLKKRKAVAVRGHKMMKDKRDELVRRFIVLARKNKELREQTEAKMAVAMQNFVLAKATMSNNEIEEALLYPARGIQVDAEKQNILSIPVPQLSMSTSEEIVYPYGFSSTSADLDGAVQAIAEALPLAAMGCFFLLSLAVAYVSATIGLCLLVVRGILKEAIDIKSENDATI